MRPIHSVTDHAVEYALRGLAQRADVRSNNVANLNTPGFRAGAVDFESVLRGAISTGTTDRAAAPVVQAGNGFPDAQGNTVDLETEMVGMIKDNLLRDAMVNSANFKANVLRTAVNGR